MGCNTSQAAKVASAATKENGINEKAEGDRKYPPGEAFEVPLDEEQDSIIKKHPPKRLQRLVDAPAAQTTIEELEEKLANAEIRRNQFLMERVSTLKLKDENDDENGSTDEAKSNEIKNDETDETTTEKPNAEADNSSVTPATEVENLNGSTNNNDETQESQ